MKVFKKTIFSVLFLCFLFQSSVAQAYGKKWVEKQLREKLIQQVTLLLYNGEVNAAKLLVEREDSKTKRRIIQALGPVQKPAKDRSSQFKVWLLDHVKSQRTVDQESVHNVSFEDEDPDADASEADEDVSLEPWAGAVSHDESDRSEVNCYEEQRRSLVTQSSGSEAEEK